MAPMTRLLPFWPEKSTPAHKLSLLRHLAPDKARALEVLLDIALADSWPVRRDPHRLGRPLTRARDQES